MKVHAGAAPPSGRGPRGSWLRGSAAVRGGIDAALQPGLVADVLDERVLMDHLAVRLDLVVGPGVVDKLAVVPALAALAEGVLGTLRLRRVA
jgi:hypothetical protein